MGFKHFHSVVSKQIKIWGAQRKAQGERMVSQFVIENDIPIPPRCGNRLRKTGRGDVKGVAAVLRRLRYGQSVVLPLDLHNASTNAHTYMGVGNYTVRKIFGGGVRVWRI